jgi:transglutaminase-like putative cysteine protease
MKYRVRHTTTYRYARPVDLASHLLHLRPRSLPHHRVLSARVTADPTPSRITEGLDAYDNAVSWLFLDAPHARFEVTLEALVDVAFPPPPEESPPWEDVAAACATAAGWQAAEFAFDSPLAPALPEAGAYVAPSFPPGQRMIVGLRDLLGRFRRDFAFRSGVTTIATPLTTVLAQRAGVCQDFTHVIIAGLRALGLPARYVSGYIRTLPPPGATKRLGSDQSHAWVGVWLGPALGWIDIDPTNNLIVSDEHVVLAWGRDYRDISPVRGIILGGGKHSLSVGVDLEPA